MVIKQSEQIMKEVGKVLMGKEEVIEKVLMAIYAGGHILLEDTPGVGKTTLALGFSRALGMEYKRIQFTPDTMPSDITGYTLPGTADSGTVYRPGAVHTNLFLGDEINRTSPKTQSALLEAMEEGSVTVDGVTYQLPKPFICIATQNPVGMSGTQPLPEAQLDRFMFKVLVRFPDKEELRGIVGLTEGHGAPEIRGLMDGEELMAARRLIARIPIAEAVMNYILELVMATHEPNPYIREGASPRAAQAMIRASRARAFMEGRLNVSFEDVQSVAYPVLRHRLILSFDAISEGITEDAVIRQIIDAREKSMYA